MNKKADVFVLFKWNRDKASVARVHAGSPRALKLAPLERIVPLLMLITVVFFDSDAFQENSENLENNQTNGYNNHLY